MKLHILTLEPFDDYPSVRDRLAFVQADRVLLVWPTGSTVATLRRKLDLVLIAREAARARMRLALVSHDATVIANAATLNISTFPSVQAATQGRWKKPRETAAPINRAALPLAPAAETLAREQFREAARRLRPIRVQSGNQRTTRAVVGIVLLVTLVAFSYILMPYAKVQVFLARDQLSATVKIIADPTIAIENISTGHIPATLVSNVIIERQGTTSTSGRADVPATIASGTIILTNQTPDPVSVPAGSIVSTFATVPARFRTLRDLVINGYGNAEVTIAAAPDSAGPIGNVDANLINRVEGNLIGKVAVRNPQATQGGTVRQQGIVTKLDQERLIGLVRDQIRTSAVADITLTPTQFIAPGSIQILEEKPEWTTYSNFIGDASDTLTLTLKVRIQALVIDELPARKVAYAGLARQLANRQIVIDSVQYQRGRVEPADAKTMVAFLMTASGDAVNAVNADDLRNRLAGMNVNDARALFEREILLDPRRPPKIDVLPGFLGRFPLLSVRIVVEVR